MADLESDRIAVAARDRRGGSSEHYLRPAARVASRVRELIESGVLAPGDRAPSERTLAASLGLDRGTVRRGLERLQAEGILLRARGASGRTVVGTGRPLSRVLAQTIAIAGSTAGVNAPSHHEPGWAEAIVLGARDAAHGARRNALSLNPDAIEGADLSRLLMEGIAGVVLADVFGRRTHWLTVVERIRASGVPFVLYGDDPTFADCDRVVSDHAAGAEALTGWLLEQGRRRPLLILPGEAADVYWAVLRRTGYERACAAAGVVPLPTLTTPPNALGFVGDDPDRFTAAARFLAGCLLDVLRGPNAPDALLAPSDGLCPMLASACRLHGVEPGRDIAIVGYDNYWHDCTERRLEPFAPAATVDKRNADCGRALVELLLERVSGRLPDAPQRRVVKPELVICRNRMDRFLAVPAGCGQEVQHAAQS